MGGYILSMTIVRNVHAWLRIVHQHVETGDCDLISFSYRVDAVENTVRRHPERRLDGDHRTGPDR